MKKRLVLGSLVAILAVFAGCSRKAAEQARDIGPEAEAYYKAHPQFFRFATPADLPKDLGWEDGHDVPEFADPQAKLGGTLHLELPDFPRTLRVAGPDSNSLRFDRGSMALVGRNSETLRYFPGLAKAWAYGNDKKTVYFKLDPEARWSDGEPVRAMDFFFTFFFYTSPYLNAPWYVNHYGETNFTNITKYDDSTISITMVTAKPDLMDQITVPPVPQHFYKELGTDYMDRYQWRCPPTTGCYIIRPEDIKKGVSVELFRIPQWWAENKVFYRHTYNFQKIHFEVIRDSNKTFEAFKRGDVDWMSLSLPQYWYDKLPDSDPLVQRGGIAKVTFYNQTPRPNYGFYINTKVPLLDNRDIRVGIAYASNFDLVDQQYFRGDYVRMQTDADDYAEVPFPDIHPRPFSVEKALESFAKAGFTQRGPDGILMNSQGQRLSFTVTTGYDTMKDVLTILREEAAKAGLEFKIEVLDASAAFKKMSEKHHQIGFSAFALGAEKYPRYWEMYHSKNAKVQTNNFTNMADPQMDQLIDTYDKATTMQEVRPLAQKMEQLIWENSAFIPSFKHPYYRLGYWRWIQWPAAFDERDSAFSSYQYCWIDESLRAPTLAAVQGGTSLPPIIKVYDQWKAK